MSIKDEVLAQAKGVHDYLATCLDHKDIPPTLAEAMRYSLLAGGKRLRPLLCLRWTELAGTDPVMAMPFAAALECIHTYSLVHDDLPAMDDDDLRRGKPSNHVKFGEATAILAGDGLLTEAFGLMCACDLPAERVVAAVSQAVDAAGAVGMVGGQVLDMEYTGREGVTLDELRGMHARKTGALIRGACVCGAILGGADQTEQERAAKYGAAIGSAFQIVDDILDVVGDTATLGKPAGSDEEEGKNTYVSLLGLDESRRLAEEQVNIATTALAPHGDSPVAQFLTRLAKYIVERAY